MPTRSSITRWTPRTAFALLLIGLGIAAIPFLWGLKIDNRLERWIDDASESAQRYAAFQALFGSDEFIVVAYTAAPLFSLQNLDVQITVLERLEALEECGEVLAIPALFRDRFAGEDDLALEQEVRENPFYQNLIFSPDPDTGAYFIASLAPEDTNRQKLVEDIAAAVEPLRAAGFETHTVGPPLLNVELDRQSHRESMISFPIALACSSLMLLLLFRDIRPTLVVILCSALSVVLMLGCVALAGISLNMITAVAPTLMWVLSQASAIHLVRRFQVHRARHSPETAMQETLRDVTRPCVLASLTTAIGFLALLSARMGPVRELGAMAGVGITASLCVALAVAPILITWFGVPAIRCRRVNLPLLGFPLRFRKVTLFALPLIAVLGVLTIRHVRVESDPLTFLPEGSTVRKDYRFVGEHMTGQSSIELVVALEKEWVEPSNWAALDHLAEALESDSMVMRVLSPLDYLRTLRHWNSEAGEYTLPESLEEAAQLIANLDAEGASLLKRMVSADGKHIRMTMLTTAMNSRDFQPLVVKTTKALDALTEPMHGYVTGIVPQLVDAQMGLVTTQVRSLMLSLLLVFICIGVGLGSFRQMLISILPNILPLWCVAIAMALFSIPLDVGTVMVASIALGIAVDDTVHLLTTYTDERRRGARSGPGLNIALEKVMPAMTLTTAAATVGFLALCRSGFAPIRHFGLLSGVALLVALLADFLLTPALLNLRWMRDDGRE